jgi:hypothetical protein
VGKSSHPSPSFLFPSCTVNVSVALNRLFSIQFIFQAFQLLLLIENLSFYLLFLGSQKAFFTDLPLPQTYARKPFSDFFFIYYYVCVSSRNMNFHAINLYLAFFFCARGTNEANGANVGKCGGMII